MTSKTTVLAVVIFLGLTVLFVIAGSVVLQVTDNGSLPDNIVTIAAGAAGALAALLASTRSTVTNGEKAPPNDLTQFVPPPAPRPAVRPVPAPTPAAPATQTVSSTESVTTTSTSGPQPADPAGAGQHP